MFSFHLLINLATSVYFLVFYVLTNLATRFYLTKPTSRGRDLGRRIAFVAVCHLNFRVYVK